MRKANNLFYCFKSFHFALSVLLLVPMVNLFAQNTEKEKVSLVTISGKVRDANTKQPVSSAQIRSLNWDAAATTNDDGSFKISIASLDEVLSVSAFDYGTREISIRGNDSVIVDLYPEIFTNPYKKIGTLTGVVENSATAQSINSIEKITASPYVSIDNEIQSQLGGNVRAITRSGITGVGTSLFTRGLNSLYANTQPLFIVDGAIWENSYEETSLHSGFYTNPLTTIDVADIENVTLIKDGTSIYGNKASNGIIIINTNRPKDVVTKIQANSYWGVTTRPESVPVMDASQFRIYASDLLRETIYAPYIENYNFLNDDPASPSYNKYHNNTDWDNQVYRSGFTQSYSLGVNGGDERAIYAFSVGYTYDKGVVKNTDMQRLNARFKADIFFTKKFSTRWNIGYTNLDRYLVDDGINYLTSPTFLSMIKAPFLSPNQYTVEGTPNTDYEYADDFGIGNPGGIIEFSLNTNKQYRFNIGVIPEYKFSQYLTLKTNFNYSLYNVRENFFRPENFSALVQYENFISKNEVKNQQSRNITLSNDAQLVYNRKFNYKHQLTGILGWRYINNFYEMDHGHGHNTANNDSKSLEDAIFGSTNGLNNRYKSISSYINVDYSLKNRYIISAAFDMDASSRFGQETKGGIDFLGKKWGLFPSLNAAWIVSSESFMKQIGLINRLKLRAGFGVTGNDDIGFYGPYPYLVSKKYMGRAVGLIIGNIANNNIQWETTYRKNVGVDLSILNERVALSFEYYNSITKDLLTLKPYPEFTGLSSYLSNSGELANKGIEATASFKVLNLRTVRWELGFSAGHYKNEIISLPEGNFSTLAYNGEVLSAVGNPAAVFYGYKTNGIFVTQADAGSANLRMNDKYGVSHSFGAGDVHFKDVNSDNIIDELDKQIIGNPNPDIYGSFTNMISFGNFTFDALITYSYGNDVYNYWRSQMEGGTGLYNQSTVMLTRWVAEGQQTSQPKAVYGDPVGNARFSDRWIEDGSFVKLKAITISYKVPVKISFIEGLNVWATANNLLTLTNYLGRDPEFSVNNSVFLQGIDMGLMPNTKSYFVGVRINL